MLEAIHTQFLRSILHASKNTPLYMIYAEFGRYPIELHVKGRMVNFFKRLISGKQTKIAFILYQKLRNTPAMKSKWIRKMQQIFQECGRSDIWQNQIPHSNICSISKQNLRDQFLQCWGSKLDHSLKGMNYRIFKSDIQIEQYFLKLPMNSYLNLAKIRTGNHRFPCECGRWQGIDLSERKCPLCNLQEIGDEYHYLLICPFLMKTAPNISKEIFAQTLISSNLKNL